MPIPEIACSLIGVFFTFSGNKFERSFVTLKAPPYGNGLNSFIFSISSPIIIEFSSFIRIFLSSSYNKSLNLFSPTNDVSTL